MSSTTSVPILLAGLVGPGGATLEHEVETVSYGSTAAVTSVV